MTAPGDNHEEVSDYETQAREFLGMAWDFLAAGNLHQASEKGWGAASHMAKAVAVAQGWQYGNHAEFSNVMYQARQLTGNPRFRQLRGVANELHLNYYKRKRNLNAGEIREDLEEVVELLEILHPLTGLAR
ncbi:MAG: hypothetical protein F4X66_00550 [Chloroflexi bacterium]|nr:hypothetical protein [Chloroflexota bacterium]MYE40964.1 hypothetical protein [Chloroflexota bacterium]